MELVCCCLSQVFFYKKLVSPDHHVDVHQHRSGLLTQHTHTHQGKKERGKLRKREKKKGKGDLHHTTPRTTTHPLTTHTHTTPHTHPTHKVKEGKGKGKRGPLC